MEEQWFTKQYMLYSKLDSNSFKWEIVPHEKCSTPIGRIFQQLQVLWRVVFGGIKTTEQTRNKQVERYKTLFAQPSTEIETTRAADISNDAFCREDVIERQWVVKRNKINVLYNYAPIGFGGERLHFLIVPKEHRKTFTDLTKKEYKHSLSLITHLVTHFTENRESIENIYIFNKTGKDAGQTVDHCHFHVIITAKKAQDIWGKLTILKNILFGSKPMDREVFTKKVDELRKELADLNTK